MNGEELFLQFVYFSNVEVVKSKLVRAKKIVKNEIFIVPVNRRSEKKKQEKKQERESKREEKTSSFFLSLSSFSADVDERSRRFEFLP